MRIADKEYRVVAYDAAGQASYLAALQEIAKSKDRPLARFLAKLQGVQGQDRTDAIRGFVGSPGWDEPPPALVRQAATSHTGVVLLAQYLLQPRPPLMELAEHVEREGPRAVYTQLVAATQPPTNEEILRRNAALKARLQAPQEPTCPTPSTTAPPASAAG